jgi:hypothetical protein
VIEQIGEFLISHGWIGILSGVIAWIGWKLWKLFEGFVTTNQELVIKLVEENQKDRDKHAERESKHDNDRDQWLSKYEVFGDLIRNLVNELKHVHESVKEIKMSGK